MFITVSVTTTVQSLGLLGAEPTFLTNSDLSNVVGGMLLRLLSVHLIVASAHDVVTWKLVGSPTLPPQPPQLHGAIILSIGILLYLTNLKSRH